MSEGDSHAPTDEGGFGKRIALGLILGTGITAANADEAPDSAEAVFSDFVDALNVSDATDAALNQKFDQLPAAEQERVADVIEEDPLSLMQFSTGAPTLTSGSETVAEPALARKVASSITTAAHHSVSTSRRALARSVASGLHIHTAVSSPRYTATYPVNASLFGITTGTFNMRYVFEATSTNVTRNLECSGWFTGAAGVWNISTSQSNYLSGGSGSCTVRYNMALAFKGSFFSTNKQQQLIYKGTRLTSASVKNV
ncbi:hypothetical protein ACF1AJ_05875 [Leifsonia sp. NPDC014704]|uniref:hypothetical protein n=1 Tax=Leifsonia sp. NPDC014704 TaxID=3364123 RepID=UPI0036F4A13A